MRKVYHSFKKNSIETQSRLLLCSNYSVIYEFVVFSGAKLAIVGEISEKGEHCLSEASCEPLK